MIFGCYKFRFSGALARRTLLALALLSGAVLAAEDLSQPRLWRDQQGRELRAVLLQIDPDGRVQMRRADGLQFYLPLRDFSSPDQRVLREYQQRSAGAVVPTARAEDSAGEEPAGELELPDKLELADVPMVKQHGNFCVPASASMIAGYHGIESDQDEIAQLSSESSISNEGTYPRDMLLAMNKLGFAGRAVYWQSEKEFIEVVLPQIRRALFETGPIYVSFGPGVFGAMGHGCVITGYNHRREELYFNNPWGNRFEKEYGAVAVQAQGIVLIDRPLAAPIASEAFIAQIQAAVPSWQGGVPELRAALSAARVEFELVWCSRRDARGDQRFAKDTARREGRKILELAFERNPAVFIPSSAAGGVEHFFLVTRPPEGGASFMVRELGRNGWGAAQLQTLGSLTRNWTTQVQLPGHSEPVWELPMFELREPK